MRAVVRLLLMAPLLLATGCLDTPSTPTASGTSAPETVRPKAQKPTTPVIRPAPTYTITAVGPLLYPARGGDGDSWKDRQGREYRLGLINTPELNECFGQAASDHRKQLTKNGFRADVYSKDGYGRRVAVVTLADGQNLNILLARTGYANDKYLAEFRHENPSLAGKLDVAFAAAKREHLGLWGKCSTPAAPAAPAPFVAAPSASDCHPAYATCIPIKGDGSGSGEANDLDCPDLRRLVLLRSVDNDPYRLDGPDHDGRGCESYA